MLVLTRKPDQSIIIYDPKTGNLVEVTVAEIKADQVRLGIAAPKNVTVDRKEVWLLKQEPQAANPAAP